jgi:hypothetical protein
MQPDNWANLHISLKFVSSTTSSVDFGGHSAGSLVWMLLKLVALKVHIHWQNHLLFRPIKNSHLSCFGQLGICVTSQMWPRQEKQGQGKLTYALPVTFRFLLCYICVLPAGWHWAEMRAVGLPWPRKTCISCRQTTEGTNFASGNAALHTCNAGRLELHDVLGQGPSLVRKDVLYLTKFLKRNGETTFGLNTRQFRKCVHYAFLWIGLTLSLTVKILYRVTLS